MSAFLICIAGALTWTVTGLLITWYELRHAPVKEN
jgi:hypothetical protein